MILEIDLLEYSKNIAEMEGSSGGGEPPDKKQLCEILQKAKGVNCGIPPNQQTTTNKQTHK